MMYDDEQIITNVASINQMAKEYARNLEEKHIQQLTEPISELYYYQERAEYCYNLLLKFAKQNAMSFVKELLKDCTVNKIKIQNIINNLEFKEIVNEASNNYVKIFKDALHCEIKSVKWCVMCINVCKNSQNKNILNNILECCELHIEKLISCF